MSFLEPCVEPRFQLGLRGDIDPGAAQVLYLVRIFDDSGQEIELPIDEIFEARLEVDWTSILKEGKARS